MVLIIVVDVQNRRRAKFHYWRAWPLIVCSLMCYVLTGTVSSIVNVASVLYEADRGWDASLLVGAMSIASFVNVVAGYVAGHFASRRSVKPMCIAWGVLFVIGVLLMGVSANIGMFVLAMRVANAASSAWGYNTMPILITRWFPTKKGTVQGFASMGILLGSTSSALYTWAYRALGPNWSTVPFAIIALLALAILVVSVTDWPEQKGLEPDTMERLPSVRDVTTGDVRAADELDANGSSQGSPGASEIRQFLSHPAFVALTLVLGIQLVYSGGIMVQLVPRLIEVGFSLDESTFIMVLTSFLACAGSFAAGVIGDRFGAKVGVCLTFALGSVGVVLNLLPNELIAVLGVVCIGCVVGSADNWPVNICAELFDRSMFPRVFGVMFPTIQLVGAIGPALVALVSRIFGSYHAAYVMLAVLMTVGAVAFPLLMDYIKNRDCPNSPASR